MTAMMVDDGKRVAAGRARLQWHMIPIADIDLIARNTRGEEMGFAFKLRNSSPAAPGKLSRRVKQERRRYACLYPPSGIYGEPSSLFSSCIVTGL
jgi:hypothetical protein